MHRMTTRAATAVAALALVGALGACAEPTQQDRDAAAAQQNVDKLVAAQPVEAGNYSPTREQIANWTRTWQSGPGKKAYTYLFSNGQPLGYYVLTGPPVSYAANATMPNSVRCGDAPIGTQCGWQPNPGQDGAFYNSGSGQFQFYGKDATTGRQLEWGGIGITYLLSDQPLRIDAPPLGDTVAPAPGGAR